MRFDEFKLNPIVESLLSEVSMSPSTLQQWAASPAAEGMLMGFEFEMIVPGVNSEEEDPEPDWDADRRIRGGIDDIIDFFSNDDYGFGLSRRDQDRKREELYEKYREWEYEALDRYMDNNSDEVNDIIRGALDDSIDYSECLDQASEELGVDREQARLNDEVRTRANEIRDEKIDEIMTDRDSREWQDAWDLAWEQMSEEFYSEDHSDEWLDDIGIRYMSDAHSEFGFDWPVWTGFNSGAGNMSIADVAGDFEHSMGVHNIAYSDNYHGYRGDRSNKWIIEPDGSLEPSDDNDSGLEFISPALPIAEALQRMKELVDWAKDYGCYTGHKNETGLHINISVPNFSIDNLDYIKLALFLGDQYVLEQFGRTGNAYAQSAIDIIKRKANQDPASLDAMFNQMKDHLNTAASKLIHSGNTQKYTSINTKTGYVEFRGPGGDYLNMDVDQLANTALRMAMALQIACDENAYKQEYAKKLYKLLGPNQQEGNTVELFTKYVNGEITKQTLKAYLQQAQATRTAKKYPPDARKRYLVWVTNNPMLKTEIIARSEQSALTRAQVQNSDWERLNDNMFTVQLLGLASEKELSQDEIAAAARASHNAANDPREDLPMWNVENINTGTITRIRAENSNSALNQMAELSGWDRNNFRIATQPATRETYGGGFRDVRVRNSITGESYTVRASTPTMAQEIATQSFGGTPFQWQVFGFPRGEF